MNVTAAVILGFMLGFDIAIIDAMIELNRLKLILHRLLMESQHQQDIILGRSQNVPHLELEHARLRSLG